MRNRCHTFLVAADEGMNTKTEASDRNSALVFKMFVSSFQLVLLTVAKHSLRQILTEGRLGPCLSFSTPSWAEAQNTAEHFQSHTTHFRELLTVGVSLKKHTQQWRETLGSRFLWKKLIVITYGEGQSSSFNRDSFKQACSFWWAASCPLFSLTWTGFKFHWSDRFTQPGWTWVRWSPFSSGAFFLVFSIAFILCCPYVWEEESSNVGSRATGNCMRVCACSAQTLKLRVTH